MCQKTHVKNKREKTLKKRPGSAGTPGPTPPPPPPPFPRFARADAPTEAPGLKSGFREIASFFQCLTSLGKNAPIKNEFRALSNQ